MVEFSKKLYDAAITAGGKGGKAESIKNLMSTMNVSIDQAMDILKTPPEEHQYFKDLLAKEQYAPPVQKAPAIWQALFLLHDIRVYICSSYPFLQTILFTTPV